jgi:hypothetical protein
LSSNILLRESLKELEFKLLEVTGPASTATTAAKRNDLVFHHLLEKENIIHQQKSELKLVQAELEQLRNILSIQQGSSSSFQQRPVAPLNNNNNPNPGPYLSLPPPQQQQQSNRFPSYSNYNNPPSSKQSNSGYYRGPGPLPQQSQQQGGTPVMGKVEAKHIILNEIKRLKESLQRFEKEKQQIVSRRTEESDRQLQLSLANQSLAHRMNELNRSSLHLRELLQQKIGFDGMVDIVESMKRIGVDCHPLLGTIPNPDKETTALEEQQQHQQHSGNDYSYNPNNNKNNLTGQFNNNRSNNSAALSGSKKNKSNPPVSEYQKALENVFLT